MMFINSIAAVAIMVSGFPAFDPATGEINENADCSSIQEINTLMEEMRASQTEVNNTDKIKEKVAQAKADGCQPDPNWGASAGKASTFMRADKERPAYVPASPSEEGVPYSFDFFGIIGSIIGQLGGGDIFPAVQQAAGAVATNNDSSGDSNP